LQGKLSVGVKTLQIKTLDETATRGQIGISRRILWDRTLADGEPQAPDGKGKSGRWDGLGSQTWHPELGSPGVSTRLMVSLHYLKYVNDLSDEGVLELWVENPYWQHLSGMKFFRAPSANRGLELE
jgi:hypothetical protein